MGTRRPPRRQAIRGARRRRLAEAAAHRAALHPGVLGAQVIELCAPTGATDWLRSSRQEPNLDTCARTTPTVASATPGVAASPSETSREKRSGSAAAPQDDSSTASAPGSASLRV